MAFTWKPSIFLKKTLDYRIHIIIIKKTTSIWVHICIFHFSFCLSNFTVHIIIILYHWTQGEELNRYGALYVERYRKLNVKVVDGSSLAVAVLLNSIPRGTTQVVLRGKLTKVAYALAFNLCQRGIKVRLFCSSQHKKKA